MSELDGSMGDPNDNVHRLLADLDYQTDTVQPTGEPPSIEDAASDEAPRKSDFISDFLSDLLQEEDGDVPVGQGPGTIDAETRRILRSRDAAKAAVGAYPKHLAELDVGNLLHLVAMLKGIVEDHRHPGNLPKQMAFGKLRFDIVWSKGVSGGAALRGEFRADDRLWLVDGLARFGWRHGLDVGHVHVRDALDTDESRLHPEFGEKLMEAFAKTCTQSNDAFAVVAARLLVRDYGHLPAPKIILPPLAHESGKIAVMADMKLDSDVISMRVLSPDEVYVHPTRIKRYVGRATRKVIDFELKGNVRLDVGDSVIGIVKTVGKTSVSSTRLAHNLNVAILELARRAAKENADRFALRQTQLEAAREGNALGEAMKNITQTLGPIRDLQALLALFDGIEDDVPRSGRID